MPSSEPAALKWCVDDILTFGDAELVRYLQENRRQDGGFDLECEGWGNLSKDQRDKLAQKLRVGAQNANDVVQSRPVDLDQVAARLLDISADKTNSPQALYRPSYRERSPTLPPPSDEEFETGAYNELINDGGRPLYPIDFLMEVSKNPGKYQEMLQPWLEIPNANPPYWEVFMRQLRGWKQFRRWQKYNREDHSDWGDLMFVEVDLAYNRFVQACRYEYPNYTEAVKKLLEQHGFTRSFQFQDDPKQQDKLTTWIEYLGFEFWQFEWFTRSIKRLQSKYDEAWKKLVDSAVLKPSETAESLRTTESAFRRAGEREQAEKALKSAKSAAGAVLTATQRARNDPRRSEITRPDRLRMLEEAQSRLDAAQTSLNSIRRRNNLVTDFIRGTWDYKKAEKDAEEYSILVRWILEQLPLVEAEPEESKAAEGGSNVRRGTKRRHQDDELRTGRNLKKRRGNDQSSCLNARAGSTTQLKGRSKRNHRDDAIDDGRPSERYRDGGQDSNYLPNTSGDPRGTLVRGSQRSEILAATEQNDDGDKLVPRHTNIPSNRLLRSRFRQSPVISQQLRRSPRIVACQEDTSRIAVISPCSVKSSRQRARRKITQG